MVIQYGDPNTRSRHFWLVPEAGPESLEGKAMGKRQASPGAILLAVLVTIVVVGLIWRYGREEHWRESEKTRIEASSWQKQLWPGVYEGQATVVVAPDNSTTATIKLK